MRDSIGLGLPDIPHLSIRDQESVVVLYTFHALQLRVKGIILSGRVGYLRGQILLACTCLSSLDGGTPLVPFPIVVPELGIMFFCRFLDAIPLEADVLETSLQGSSHLEVAKIGSY